MKRRIHGIIARFRRDEKGATAVEFAMVSVAFLTFVIGIYAAGIYFLTWNRLQQGVENAARFAAVHTDATTDDLEEIIIENIQSIGGVEDNLEISVTDTAANGINFREVTAVYAFNWNLPFMPTSINEIAMEVTSRTPISN